MTVARDSMPSCRSQLPRRKGAVAALAALVCALSAFVGMGAAPASAATVVKGCTIVSNPTAGTHTTCNLKNMSGGNFSGLNLAFANFSVANLSTADLSNANLSNANLSLVNLNGANLSNANFSGADLTGVDLRNANLQNAKFTNANLTGALFNGAKLGGANFAGARITVANFNTGLFAGTTMPNGTVNSTGSTIVVSPSPAAVANGLARSFTATAKYSNGTTFPLSSNVAWSSSNASVATITSAGVATGVVPDAPYNPANFPKTSTITATVGNVSGTSVLTIGPPNLTSLGVSPASASILVGDTQPFAATGTFTDGSTGTPTGVGWSTNNPAAATVSATGVATGNGAGSATITASAGGFSGTASIVVTPSLVVTTASLPDGLVNVLYSQTLASSGGTGTTSWSLIGSLPDGLSLDSNSGVISGTPTTAGKVDFSVRVTDSGSPAQTATQALSITVNAPLAITTNAFPDATNGVSYDSGVTAVGGAGTYSWSATGVPSPFTFNSSGHLVGTPTASGVITIDVTVTDAASHSVTKTLQLKVFAPPMHTVGSSLFASIPVGTPLATAYHPITVTSGGQAPFTYQVTAGAPGLPLGLTLDPSTGLVSGTPQFSGDFGFTVTVFDSGTPQQSKSFTTSITVIGDLLITTNSLPNGQALGTGQLCPITCAASYSTTLAGTGSNGAPTFWAIQPSALPPGLSLNQSTGEISGVATTAGTYTFTVSFDAVNFAPALKQLSITIVSAPPTLQPFLSPDGVLNQPFSFGPLNVVDGVGPFTWSATGLPAGLTIDPSTGVVSGTPVNLGTVNGTTIQVSDSLSRVDSRVTTVSILYPLAITGQFPVAATGSPYLTAMTATGGRAPYSWSVSAGTLPPGLSLSSGGIVSGTPTQSGPFTFTLRVEDGTSPVHQVATKSVNILVATTSTSTPVIHLPGLEGTPTTSYSGQLTATGLIGAAHWTITGLPPGLTYDANTGVISGTPATFGVYDNVIIRLDDTGVGGGFAVVWTTFVSDNPACVLCGL